MSVKAKERKVQLPMQMMRAELAPASFNSEKRTIDLVWSVGKKGLRGYYDPYFEELSMDSTHVRMGRLESGSTPFVDSHAAWRTSAVLGVVEKASIDGGKGVATIRLADPETLENADAKDTIRKIEAGILKNISVGYTVYRYERQPQAEGEEFPTYLAVDWEPTEISIVPVGFDEHAVVRGKEETTAPCVFVDNNEIPTERDEEVSEMTEEQKREMEAAKAAAAKEAADKAKAAEKIRQAGIRTIAKKMDLDEKFISEMIDGDTDLDKVRELAIERMEAKKPEVSNAGSRIQAGAQDETETRQAGVENALLARIGVQGHQLSEQGRQFSGMSLLRIAEEFVGPSARGMEPGRLASRSLSSSDFPLVLGNVAEKMLMNAYNTLGRTFEPFCSKGELTDYKSAKRYQVGDAPSLLEVKEGSEYKHGSFGEKAETISLADYGRILKFTRQMLINDDLGAFQRVMQSFGSAAARLESKMVYTDTLVGNPAMSDTVALFHADHANLATGSAIDDTNLALIEKLLMGQTTLDGLDYLNLSPKFLLTGTAYSVAARKILASVTSIKSSEVNVFQGAYQHIMDPRITGNKWFLACDPSQIATIEVARLRGESGPVIDSKEGFNSDGLEIKCRHTVAVKALEWKGMAYNPGA